MVGVNAYLPKGLDDEWVAFTLFLVPAPVLYLVTAILAAYEYWLAYPLFLWSTILLIVLFITLGIWSGWEKRTERAIKQRLRKRNLALYGLLGRSTAP